VSEGPTVKKYPFLNFFLLPLFMLNFVNLMLKWQTYLIRSVFVGPSVMPRRPGDRGRDPDLTLAFWESPCET
jgi:hypothetical protein